MANPVGRIVDSSMSLDFDLAVVRRNRFGSLIVNTVRNENSFSRRRESITLERSFVSTPFGRVAGYTIREKRV